MRTALAACALLLAAPAPALAAEPTGTWLAAEGKSHVRVSKCGANLCGSVVWLKAPNDDGGKPKLDIHNAEPGQRSRPIMGVPVLLSMAPEGDLWRGRIYNAEDGKTYAATFKLSGEREAVVQGCVAAVFCKTQTWTRQ